MTHAHRRDLELVASVLKGDESALDALIDDYYPRLYRFAYPRVGSDAEAAQDVVQGTFEKVIPKLGTYRAEAQLFTWICSFCRFEIAAHWRRLGRSAPTVPLVEDDSEVRAALESFSDERDAPDRKYERRELGRFVRVVLDHLPLHYGKVLELKYLQELSVREIAERLSVTPKTVESRLTRARQAFRDGFGTMLERESS